MININLSRRGAKALRPLFMPFDLRNQFVETLANSKTFESLPFWCQEIIIYAEQFPNVKETSVLIPRRILPRGFKSDVLKGDYLGHPFRGNQWTDSSGVSQGGVASSFNQDRLRRDGAMTPKPVIKPKVLVKPNVLTSNNVTRQIDDLLSKNKIMEDARTKFNADYYGDFLQQVKNLGYEVTSRRDVILDGVKTDLSDISRTRPDHPIGKLRAEYDRSEAQRRDAYFTAVNSVFYSSFDLPDGKNVYDAAVKLTGEKVYTGIYRAGGGDHVQQIIDLSVRSEKDRRTQERFVFDEGCTGPSGIGKGATGVNKALREGRVTPFARAVDASMLITNQPLAGYRGASLPRSIIDKLVVGSTYKEKGFMSVAPQRSTATFYAKVRNEHVGADSRVVIFRMLMPEGIKANPMRTDEIVIARNSTVRVAAVREVKDPELGAILEVDAVVEQ